MTLAPHRKPDRADGATIGDRPFARFDDLSVGGGSFILTDPEDTFTARTSDEVIPTLRAAERAARAGQWVAGFLSYEAAAGLDPSLPVATRWPSRHPLRDLPLAWFAGFAGKVEIPAQAVPDVVQHSIGWNFHRDENWHRTAVDRIRADIASGAYYQVNLTVQASAQVDDPQTLYTHLQRGQRAQFHTLLATGAYTVMSASPELFFTLRDGWITTRPMKGTARRSTDPVQDRRQAEKLRASPKERAENVMIVDLLRNDLSRIALPGTVSVPRLFQVERYPTLWQMTSTVTARSRPDIELCDVFQALFPCGSVTGAPKRAAMSAIVDIESRPRGIYCGAIGLLSPRMSEARFSVAIRTATSGPGGETEYGAGGAITHPSNAADEWQEMVAKARVLHHPG